VQSVSLFSLEKCLFAALQNYACLIPEDGILKRSAFLSKLGKLAVLSIGVALNAPA
jgi:hypothetical protein